MRESIILNTNEIASLLVYLSDCKNVVKAVISQDSNTGIGKSTTLYVYEINDGVEVLYEEDLTDYGHW